jgi:cyclase
MLKHRVIPTLLWKPPGLVKGVGFDSWRSIGAVMPAIKVYNMRDVDELILVDISATAEERTPDFDDLAQLTAECFVPLTVGGGVTGVDTIRELLKAGADKVSINSTAYENPGLIEEASRRYGKQCVVASIDAMRQPDGSWRCHSHSGTRPTDWHPGAWARELEKLGAGEILITSIERDGTMDGYDFELIREVTGSVEIPVIASGGAASIDDMLAAIRDCHASAVAAASVYQFTELTPAQVKQQLALQGIPVRRDLALQLQEGG